MSMTLPPPTARNASMLWAFAKSDASRKLTSVGSTRTLEWVVRRTLIGGRHDDLVIEGEWDFMLGERVEGLLHRWQAGTQGSRQIEARIEKCSLDQGGVSVDSNSLGSQ